MKITFDHNCLIDLDANGEVARTIRTMLSDPGSQCFVVNVGASEMQRFGVRPDNYSAFESFLTRIGVAQLPRLNPIGIADVTFWDRAIYAGADDQVLLKSIQSLLFPTGKPFAEAANVGDPRKALNQMCDALSMWCHIHYKNDVFLTTDNNFYKASKLPKLLALGAGRICSPSNFRGTTANDAT